MLPGLELDESLDSRRSEPRLKSRAAMLALAVAAVGGAVTALATNDMMVSALALAAALGLGVGLLAYQETRRLQAAGRSARAKALTADVTKSMLSRAIEERRQALAAAEAAHAQLERAHREWIDAFDAVHLLVFLHDVDFRIMRANRAYLALAGVSMAEAEGQPYWQVFPKMAGPLPGCTAVREGAAGMSEEITLDDGRTYVSHGFRISEGDNPYAIHILEDVTEHRAMVERISHLAHHDTLTGLPNRALFEDRCEQALHLARRSQRKMALLLLDLDRFKPINDNYGHEVGDEVLQAVATRLQQCLRRRSDTVARLGGDEFVVLLPDIDATVDAEAVARNMVAAIGAPIATRRGDLDLGVSIGVAFFPQHGGDSKELLRQADQAMYQVKGQGRNHFATAPLS